LIPVKAARSPLRHTAPVYHAMKFSSISPATTVGEIVTAQPLLARLFERVGIDYCCGGKRTLAEACRTRGLDVATFATMLEAAARLPAEAPIVDAAAMSLTALADHIEATHHAYLREALPELAEKARRVAGKHGERDPRLVALRDTLEHLAVEMFEHMAKEEQRAFPLVRDLERAVVTQDSAGSLAALVREMESEHDAAGAAVARLRELTDGFRPDAGACNTHHALLAGLAHLEADLHQHVHKENNVLFPRALILEAQATAATGRSSLASH
jgi:regulator of cell morphogenesis and NO signaling